MASIIKRTDKPTIVRGMGSNVVLRPSGLIGPIGPVGPPGGSDAAFAGWVNDPASETREALSATYARKNTEHALFTGSERVRAMAAKPPYDAPVLATPPTVTQGTTQGASLTKNFSYTSTMLRWPGFVDTTVGSATPRHFTRPDGTRASSVPTTQVAFDFDGVQFDFVLKSNSGTRFRIWVNEQAATATMVSTTVAAGTVEYLNVNFGSASLGNPRRIVVELQDTSNLIQMYGLRIGPTDTVTPPQIKSPRVMVVGDSYAAGQGASFFSESYSRSLGRLMGWADTWSEFTSVSSTGLVATGGTTVGPYGGNRLTYDVIPFNPDMVIVQGSINDTPHLGAIGPALTSYVNTLKAAHPACVVVVTSPLYTATPTAEINSVRDEMQTAAAALDVPFIDMLGPGYFFGTGRLGTTTGDGNADVYRASDGSHPTKEGHFMLARILAGQLTEALDLAA